MLLFTLLTFGGVLLVVTAAEAGGGNNSGHAHGSNGLRGLVSPHRMLLSLAAGGRHGSPTGNGATLLSALLYGTYAVQLKRDIPSEEAVPMPYLFGLLGLMTILIFTPWIAIFHMLKLESFSCQARQLWLRLSSMVCLAPFSPTCCWLAQCCSLRPLLRQSVSHFPFHLPWALTHCGIAATLDTTWSFEQSSCGWVLWA